MPNFLKIAAFELVRLLLTRRGLLSILAFMLVWLLIFRYAIWPASSYLRANSGNELLGWVLERLNAGSLTTWSVPELGVYWYFALLLLPFFTVVVTADQTASDRARGTLRFLHLRATRTEIYFGRFTGQMLILLLFIAFTLVSTLAVALYRDALITGSALRNAAMIMAQLVLVLMPFAALMALASILARSARQAMVFATVAWILISITLWAIDSYFPGMVFIEWVLPGAQIKYLKNFDLQGEVAIYVLPLSQTIVLLAAGWFVARRIDL